MARYFNTTGPCMPHMHYMLPPADRLIGASLDRYIRDQLYWVLHAPRQALGATPRPRAARHCRRQARRRRLVLTERPLHQQASPHL